MTTLAQRLNLSGVFPPIPTPFHGSGDVDFGALRGNVERWNAKPLRGYVVGGSNGEFPLLSLDERLRAVEAVRKSAAPGRILLAGSGMESTHATIDLTRRMANAGAHGVLVVTPSYYRGRMTSAALAAHYTAVADDSPVPVILYNVPANTGVDLPIEAAIELSRHPNILGMKESGGDVAKIGRILAGADPDFQMLAGSGGFFLGALSVGAVGCIAALANIAAAELAALFQHSQAGEIEAARSLQHRLVEANAAVTSVYGVPGLKAALEMVGFYGGPVRSPLQPLADGDKARLREILERAGLVA